MENRVKIKKEQTNKEITEWAKSITIAVLVAMFFRLFIFEFVIVTQSSMYPTLKETEKICYIKVAYLLNPPARGDIVIVKIDDATDYVKRVVALGGETIEIKDNKVYINGVILKEDYLVKGLEFKNYAAVRVPEGSYFVMGDNRPVSLDSRYADIGFIAKKNILGKVVFRIKPFMIF